jgi:hypothetical protein
VEPALPKTSRKIKQPLAGLRICQVSIVDRYEHGTSRREPAEGLFKMAELGG